MHDSLLMGERAHSYFINVQKAHHWDPSRVYPSHNIFDNTQRSTYQYEFFDNPVVQPLWRYTNSLIDAMGLPRKVATLNEVYMAIYDIGGNSDMNHILNLNLITLTLKSIWDVYVTQMQHHCKTNPTPLPKLAKMVQHKLPQAYKS